MKKDFVNYIVLKFLDDYNMGHARLSREGEKGGSGKTFLSFFVFLGPLL